MTNATPPAAPVDRDAMMALMRPLTALVARAGAAIMAVNRQGMKVDGKSDGSPITEADLAADRIIAEGLARLAPKIPVISEESVQLARPPHRGSFFLVDPLDGTKEFVAGRDEFTVNVALVQDGVPVLGLIGVPALGLIWRGLVGHGAERVTASADDTIGPAVSIRTRPSPTAGHPSTVAVSRSHGDSRTEAFIATRPGAIRRQLGSAVKFGRVAEGEADIYPRLAPTCEWDVAAGHALVVAAGGAVTDSRGAPVPFGGQHPGFIVPEFIAWGDPAAVRPV